MDAKMLNELRYDGGARKRRSSAVTQQQHQHQLLQPLQPLQPPARSRLPRQERAIGGANRGKVATKHSHAKSSVAVVPPSRQNRKSQQHHHHPHHNNSNRREREPPFTTRFAFGSTCSSRQTGHKTLPLLLPPTAAGAQRVKQRMDTPHPMAKPMAAAHEQLELLLTRIEQGSDASIATMPMPMPTSTATMAATRRRKPLPARAVRRHMEHPPPVPTVTPLSSARNNNNHLEQLLQAVTATTTAAMTTTMTTTTSTSLPNIELPTATETADSSARFVPLTQNPQSLPAEKRRALLELLSRAEQRDQEIVNVLRSEVNEAGDPSRDAMRLTLQMLPMALKPGDSPYRKRFWDGHRYLKERQRLHQQLQPDDLRYKAVKILRSSDGSYFLSKTLEEELKDEKQVLDFVESELQRNQDMSMTPEQRARQDQALNERRELDRQKQQISEWRARHRCRELKRAEKLIHKKMMAKAKQLQRENKQLMHLPQPMAQQQRTVLSVIAEEIMASPTGVQLLESDTFTKMKPIPELEVVWDDDTTPRPTAAQAAMSKEHMELLLQRQQFREQCHSSSFYNNSKCEKPWKLFANIANKLGAELTKKVDEELHRSIAGYLKDFVANETLIAKQSN